MFSPKFSFSSIVNRFSFSVPLGIAIGVLFTAYAVFAVFQGPTASPPGGNVYAPINVGPQNQTKAGGLFVRSFGVEGGAAINTAGGGGKPVCDSTIRGTLWFTQGGAGVKDTLEVCAKDADETYAWRLLY